MYKLVQCMCIKCANIQQESINNTPVTIKCTNCGRTGVLLRIPAVGAAQF